MTSKRKRRYLWLDMWDIEEQEAWLSDMSLQGWQLVKITNFFAQFKESQPQHVNYRCDLFKLDDTSEENRIDFYRHAGWEYVGSRKYVHIFKEMQDNETEDIHTDPAEQAETVSILQKSIYTRGMLTILLSVVMLLLTYERLQIDPVGNYLNDSFIESIVLVIIYLFISYSMIRGMVHVSKLRKRLKHGKLLNHTINYKKKMNRNKVMHCIVVVIAAFWVISVWMKVLPFQDDRFPPVPDRELPVVQLSDFMSDSELRYYTDENQGSRSNYYRVQSSIIVPNQYELHQQVDVPDMMWEDGSGVYSPTLWSNGYELRNEWLAKQFLKALKEKNTYPGEYFERVNKTRFDELWVNISDPNNPSFIARTDESVYRVVYFGMEPVERIIEVAWDQF